MAWFNRDKPFLYKSVSPAWSDPNLAELADCIESSTVFGHVRAASPGSVVSHENCHPFKYGRLVFMHNGHVEQFSTSQFKRLLLTRLTDDAFKFIKGLTDSEHVFALLLTHLSDPGRSTPFHPNELMAAVTKTLKVIEELLVTSKIMDGFTSLNLALTDGETIITLRFCDKYPEIPPPSLYFAFPTNLNLREALGSGNWNSGDGPGDGTKHTAEIFSPPPTGTVSAFGRKRGKREPSTVEISAACPIPEGVMYTTHDERWARDAAYLETTKSTAGERALLVASEPAIPDLIWLALPANTMLVFNSKSQGPPELHNVITR